MRVVLAIRIWWVLVLKECWRLVISFLSAVISRNSYGGLLLNFRIGSFLLFFLSRKRLSIRLDLSLLWSLFFLLQTLTGCNNFWFFCTFSFLYRWISVLNFWQWLYFLFFHLCLMLLFDLLLFSQLFLLFSQLLLLFSGLYLFIPDLKLFLDLLGFDKFLMDDLLIFCLLLDFMALNVRESTFFEILPWRRWMSIDNYWLLSCSFIENSLPDC